MTDRPEIGATLDHLHIESDDPAALAQHFGALLGARPREHASNFICQGPRRTLIVGHGQKNRLGFAAFRFADARALQRYRARLRDRGADIAANPSPLFSTDAFSVRDPDGNRLVFGVATCAPPARRADPSDSIAPAARLQHFGMRTCDPERLSAFYCDMLEFTLSDRINDSSGKLRAAFCRTNHEHHSIALFLAPEPRIDHISFDTPDVIGIRDWADYMGAQRAPIFWGVGRHGPGNDLFFMVQDRDSNLIEISSELEQCDPERAVREWPYENWTMNRWGPTFMRS